MNQDYKLPPRKWYTLEQAIKRIKQLTGEELEIADLIHFWLIGKINIATNIFFSSFKDITTLDENTSDFIIEESPENSFYLGGNKFDFSEISFCNYVSLDMMINGSYCFFCDNDFLCSGLEIGSNDLDIENNCNLSKALKGVSTNLGNNFDINNVVNFSAINLKGFIYLGVSGSFSRTYPNFYNLESEILINKKLPSEAIENWFQYDKEAENYIKFFIFLEKKFDIGFNNLFVTEDAIQKFIRKENALILPQIENKPHPKTLNAQAEFIRNLLIMFYDETTANNIRKELDNPNSEISKDFEQKGLPTPSGKTVDRWINQP
ncbi:hypothetical protein Q7473_08525 [Glaesserella parasuis]|nr:hypothetical protein [Glaesserella parasuis]